MWGQSNLGLEKKVETTNVLDTNRQFLTGCFCHWLIKNRPLIRHIEILPASNTINQIIYQVDCEVKTDVSLDHTFAHWTALCRTLLSGNNMSVFLIACKYLLSTLAVASVLTVQKGCKNVANDGHLQYWEWWSLATFLQPFQSGNTLLMTHSSSGLILCCKGIQVQAQV